MNKYLIVTVLVSLLIIGCQDPKTKEQTIVINEIMTNNSGANSILDSDQQSSDWIELYNWGKDTIQLFNLFISDNVNEPMKSPLPPYSLEPGGYLLLWGGKSNSDPLNHLGFSLSDKDKGVYIFDNAGEIVDMVRFDRFEQEPDLTYARYPDGSSNWIICSQATPSERNVGK